MPRARVIESNGIEELNGTLTSERDVDLILLDLSMPGVQGFSGLIALRAQHPDVPVVIVSATEEALAIRRAMEFGASGFIPKSLDIDTIGTAIQAVLAGDTWTPPDIDLSATEDKETADLVRRVSTLTPQQVRVLMMLSEGLLNKQIAYELSVSEATVKAHVSAILDKLGVDSRTQAVIAAARIGVTSRTSPASVD
jgi:DNA-binding NarL/FixJ family response regulator